MITAVREEYAKEFGAVMRVTLQKSVKKTVFFKKDLYLQY